MKKVIISVVIVLIVLWGIIFAIDYSRCCNFEEPIFVVAGEPLDDDGSRTYYGLGYKVDIRKTISEEDEPSLVKVEMYLFNIFVTGAVTDISNDSLNTEYENVEEGQYEFNATIIKANDNSIVVEPDK